MVEPYDASPSRADDVVSVDELDALVAGEARAFGRDPRKITHFLRRVALTVRAYRHQIQTLHRDVQAASLVAQTAGRPTTLSPLDALRYVAPDQLETIFDGHMREKLAAVEQARADADRARMEAVALLNRLKFAAANLCEDPTVDVRSKERFAQLLAQLPAGADRPGPAASGDGLDALFG